MIASPRRLVAAVLAVAAAAAGAQPQPPESASQVQPALAAADAAWARRDEPGQLDALKRALADAERLAPNDYDVLWRLSRLYFWESDDLKLPDDQKSKLGKQGWDYGERAIAANPKGVEGYFYAAGGMGNYSLGIGVVNALLQGIEGKFRDRLSKAEQIDAGYNSGGVYNAWGRFYFKLPFPKYDAKKSESNLRKAIKMNPDNVRARVYLAELYLKESHPKEARKLLEEATANPPGRYDAPEERRYQARAKELLAQNR
jgi:tetratricopeptide (TPR) repeat protein